MVNLEEHGSEAEIEDLTSVRVRSPRPKTVKYYNCLDNFGPWLWTEILKRIRTGMVDDCGSVSSRGDEDTDRGHGHLYISVPLRWRRFVVTYSSTESVRKYSCATEMEKKKFYRFCQHEQF